MNQIIISARKFLSLLEDEDIQSCMNHHNNDEDKLLYIKNLLFLAAKHDKSKILVRSLQNMKQIASKEKFTETMQDLLEKNTFHKNIMLILSIEIDDLAKCTQLLRTGAHIPDDSNGNTLHNVLLLYTYLLPFFK